MVFNTKLSPGIIKIIVQKIINQKISFFFYLEIFAQYDYGFEENLRLYNSSIPPEYPLRNVKIPITIFYTVNDFLSAPEVIINSYKKIGITKKLQISLNSSIIGQNKNKICE